MMMPNSHFDSTTSVHRCGISFSLTVRHVPTENKIAARPLYYAGSLLDLVMYEATTHINSCLLMTSINAYSLRDK